MTNKRHTAWVIMEVNNICSLNCDYCFAPKKGNPIEIKSIDVPNLVSALEKTGKIFKISFSGPGEPFLTPNMIETCQALSEKHFLDFHTNLTSGKMKFFAEKIDPKRVITILASLHIKELEKTNLLERYIENFLILKNKGFNIIAREVGHPSLIDEVKKYTVFFNQKGINIGFVPFVGTYKNKKYPQSYTEDELKTFGFNRERSQVFEHPKKNNLCNAGYNAIVIDLDGVVRRCPAFTKGDLGDIYSGIKFDNKIFDCPMPFCKEPIKEYDKKLFENAIRENEEKINTN